MRKAAGKTNENEAKKQKRGISWYVISYFLGNSLAGKEAHALDGVIRANERTIMVERNFWCHLILWLNLKDKDIIKINPDLMVFISRNNLPEKKDWTYMINLDEYRSTGSPWIAFHMDSNNASYFYTFQNKTKKVIENENTTTNIYWIQAHDSLTGEYSCHGFIDLMLNNKRLTDLGNFFP